MECDITVFRLNSQIEARFQYWERQVLKPVVKKHRKNRLFPLPQTGSLMYRHSGQLKDF